MALIACPECKSEISDQAPSCPKCGCPIQPIKTSTPAPVIEKPITPKKSAFKVFRILLQVIGLLFVGLVVFGYFHQKNKVADKPYMPIEIKYRKAMLSSGLVGIFKNNSNRSLVVIATFENPTTQQKKSFRLDLAPGGTKEIGHIEGWDFASGDLITLQHNDYRNLSVKLP